MVETGDPAPDFAGSIADGDGRPFRLAEHVGEGPVVLAFFPAAFSGTCTRELCAFRDDLGRFESVGATVFGVSTDLTYALERFREEHDIPFGLVSDASHDGIEAYGVVDSFDHIGLDPVAKRAVFVVDTDGKVTYRWVADDPGEEPPYDDVAGAVAALG